MRAKAILYHLGEDTEKGRTVREILREMKIPALTVDETQLDETAGRLAALNAPPAEQPSDPAGAPEAEFLLLCGFGDRQLDRLLTALRRAEAPVAYKAVLTEHNRHWTLGELMREVAREHETMSKSN